MASDVDWIARFRAESERIAQYDPEYAAALPQTLLLNEIDRLTAERDGYLASLKAAALREREQARRINQTRRERDAARRRLDDARSELYQLRILVARHELDGERP